MADLTPVRGQAEDTPVDFTAIVGHGVTEELVVHARELLDAVRRNHGTDLSMAFADASAVMHEIWTRSARPDDPPPEDEVSNALGLFYGAAGMAVILAAAIDDAYDLDELIAWTRDRTTYRQSRSYGHTHRCAVSWARDCERDRATRAPDDEPDFSPSGRVLEHSRQLATAGVSEPAIRTLAARNFWCSGDLGCVRGPDSGPEITELLDHGLVVPTRDSAGEVQLVVADIDHWLERQQRRPTAPVLSLVNTARGQRRGTTGRGG